MRRTSKRTFAPVWLLAAILTAGCSASLVSTHVPKTPELTQQNPEGEKTVTGGMFYTLPRTVVTVSLPVSLIEKEPGEFGEFAPLFFYDRLAERVDKDRKLTVKPATFATRGEPDPTQVYYVKASGKGAIEQSLTFTFTEQGAVTGLKAMASNQTASVVLAGVSGVTSILTKTLLEAAGPAASVGLLDSKVGVDCQRSPTEENKTVHFRECFLEAKVPELLTTFDLLLTPDEKRPLLEAYLAVPPKTTNDGDGGSTPQSLKLKGQLRRRALFQARDSYSLFVVLVEARNDALGQPTEALEGFGDALKKNEEIAKSLVQRFLGKKSETKWNGLFKVVPGRTGQGGCIDERTSPCDSWRSEPLLTYVPDGICDYADLLGAPKPNEKLLVPAKDENDRESKCKGAEELRLRLTLDPADDQLVSRLADNYKPASPAGLYFIVPARMRAEVVHGTGGETKTTQATTDAGETKDSVGEIRLMIAQHGIVSAMPSKLGGQSIAHDLKFYDASGALKSYSLVSKPMLTKGMVDSISASTNALIDARNKQLDAEREAADQAKQIAATKNLLENLVKIQEACGKLENPPEGCGS